MPNEAKKHAPGDAMTYDEWRKLGFHVRRGEKMCGRNEEGIAVFSPSQVDEDDDEPMPDEYKYGSD
jgi:hypothetical protein